MADLVGSRRLSVVQFAGAAELLRRILVEKDEKASQDLLAHAHDFLADADLLVRGPHHAKAIAFLEELDDIAAQGTRPTVHEFAQRVGTIVPVLESVLAMSTGRAFGEWRRLVAGRHAARRLRDSSERVSQVAYSLGYDHHSQFDREFRRTLGLTPQGFRRCLLNRAGKRVSDSKATPAPTARRD